MTPLKWTTRIVGAGLLFVGALWATAPAQANELNIPAVHAAGCVTFGQIINVNQTIQDVYFKQLQEATENEIEAAFYLGFSHGYLRAAANISGMHPVELAKLSYANDCKVQTL